MTDTLPTIHQSLIQVMEKLEGISKSGTNTHQNYNFRGIDQVMGALHQPLVDCKVLMLPDYELVSEEDRETTNANGEPRVSRFVTVQATYTFIGPAADSLTVRTVGSASDTADKAVNKAMAAALKYAVLQTFMVPVGDPDADEETNEATGLATNRRDTARTQSPGRSPRGNLATESQKNALEKIHAARKLNVDARMFARWGKTLDELTKPEASRWFDELNGKVDPPEGLG